MVQAFELSLRIVAAASAGALASAAALASAGALASAAALPWLQQQL
jgi:hypothetical protein